MAKSYDINVHLKKIINASSTPQVISRSIV